MKVSSMTENFIFNANIQLDGFPDRQALLGQKSSHEKADFKHSPMQWIVFGLKEPEHSFFFSFHLCLTKEVQQWHPASGLQQVREGSLLQLWQVLSMSSGIIRILITAKFLCPIVMAVMV